MGTDKVSLQDGFARIREHWKPRIAGELNGQHIKLVKFQGEFVWHSHAEADEMFLVVDGRFTMQFRDRDVELQSGEFLVVPRGVEHCPRAEHEVQVLLFEPVGTLNTGEVRDAKTVDHPEPL